MRIDDAPGLLREGYTWAGRLRGDRPAVPIRLLGRRAALVGGPEGVRRFYDPSLRRRGALPLPVKLVLFGRGSIHGLDDAEHRHDKAMYLNVLTPAAVDDLSRRAQAEWSAAASSWTADRPVVLFDEAVRVLTASVLSWAGIPDPRADVTGRRLAAVLDGFATPGAPYARAALARWRLNRWAAGLVRKVRRNQIQPRPGTALDVAARARDLDGSLLSETRAAVALLNVVRPTVAVAWFVTYAGIALHQQPEWRRRVASGDSAACRAFAQEVRRLYPFVPVLAARARDEQDVLGVRVPAGGLVVLDVHGTDHDPTHWPEPERFDPNRFLSGPVDPDTLVPQGGGDVRTGHRCPGEDVTLTMIEVATRALAETPYTLPPQDFRVDLSRMPTLPRSRVVMTVPPSSDQRPSETEPSRSGHEIA
ncbi:cytochrome P450 [Jiangella ureilytica]|uniref:Cytochrome P450 n=1 Tax=Jiangella ureilytica TaxID=2530374 RepID=A0A4R4RLV1_9ACTN|nr:cytochrome P450 [Jiangella ureilytica]TDC50394.1 cytochrome P450 [Jiangella ureilytica]